MTPQPKTDFFYRTNKLPIYGLFNSLHIDRTDFKSILQIEQTMNKQKAADTESQIYAFLKPPYVVEPDLPFISGPGPHHKLTAKEFDQGMFQHAQKGIKAPNEQARYKAMVTMRQIVGLIEAREQIFVKEYIYAQLIDYCFREIQQNRPRTLRYEALLILENLANDSDLCSHLITSKNCIQVLLDFLGNQDHTLIRKKGKQVLREIITQNTQVMHPQKNTIVVDVIPMLKKVEKRIQAREIIWIIQKIYNKEIGSKQPEIVHQICSVFCEAIKSKLFEDDERQEGSDLAVVLCGLSTLYFQHEEVVACISRYEILGQLMDYARLEENLSLPAMIILEGFVEELVQNNMFLDLAQFLLTEKQEKSWPTLSVLLKILSKMAFEIDDELQFLDFALSRPQLLKSLTSLMWSNRQPQKDKEVETKKQKAIPQIAASICNLYLNMMAADIEKDSNQHKMILEFIWSQDIPSVALILLSAYAPQNRNFQLGLEIIEIIANYAEEQETNELTIIQNLQMLKILPLLKRLEKSENSKLSAPAKRILEIYFRLSNSNKQGKLNKLNKLGKQDDDNKEEESKGKKI